MSETDNPTPPPGVRVLGQPLAPPESDRSAAPEDAGTESATAAGPGPEAEAPAEAGLERQVRPGVLLGLVILAILGVAGTITFGLLWAHAQSQQSGANSVESGSRSAATQFLHDFTNFNSSTVARTFADIQALSTGSFASQAKAEFSASLRQQLQAANASTQGQVRYLELQSHTGTTASYFADVVQTFSNNKTSAPQSDELRLVVDLSLVHGQWKISGVTSLDTPAVPSG